MGFGIGINTEKPEQEAVQGRQTAVACECWFNSRGQTLPRLFKYEEQGEIRTVRDIHICLVEQKKYAGVSSLEYTCEILLQGQRQRVKLIFFKEDCRWVLVREASS